MKKLSVVVAWEAWYSSTVKYTEVGDEDGEIGILVVGTDNRDVRVIELEVVTLPNASTQNVWQLSVINAAAAVVIAVRFVRWRFRERLRGRSSRIVAVVIDSILILCVVFLCYGYSVLFCF